MSGGIDSLRFREYLQGMTFEVGQTVIERGQRSQRAGTVVKVARKYCTVEYAVGWGMQTCEYDKNTGFQREESFGLGRRIKTAEEWEKRDRARAVRVFLREAGVEFTFAFKGTDEQVEAIAAVMGIGQ